MTVAIMALVGGLALLAVDKQVAIAVLIASATLTILGLAAQQETMHVAERDIERVIYVKTFRGAEVSYRSVEPLPQP